MSTSHLFLLATFNYVYISEDGKVKPITLARVRRDNKKMFVKIPAENLKRETKYRVFYSVFNRMLKKNRSVEIDIDGAGSFPVSDDGTCFVYTG